MVSDGGSPVICTKASGSTTRCEGSGKFVTADNGPTYTGSFKDNRKHVGQVESSGGISSGLTTVAAWASSTRGEGSVAMKVVIKMICLMGKVTSCALTVDLTRASGVKEKVWVWKTGVVSGCRAGGCDTTSYRGQQRLVSTSQVCRWVAGR